MNPSRYASVFRDGLFAGETVIVTGAGSGFGRCMAHELAALGACVVLVGRQQAKLDAVLAEITEDGGRADTAAFDIRDEEAVEAEVARLVDRHGPVRGLVNNAGGQFPAALEDISKKGWEAVVSTNLTGGFLVSRALFRASMKTHGGAIVNIVADFWNSMVTMAHSGAARAGMVSLTQTAAVEWARHGVRVNAVAPGFVASSGFDTYEPEYRAKIRGWRDSVPLRRFGTEAEVSAAVVFLLSPAAGFITGSTIRVDGGAPNVQANMPPPPHASSHPFEGFHRAVRPKSLDET